MSIRPWHRRVARLLITGLLFMQGALAAHACQLALDAAALTPVAAQADAVAPDPCCPQHEADAAASDQHDHQTPAPGTSLCKAHCYQAQTSVSAQLQLDISALAACIVALHGPNPTPVAAVAPLPAVRDPGPPPGTPALYIAYAVLRR